MLQIGIRGLGSGEAWQHDDARGWGSKLVTSRDWHRRGAEDILNMLPEGGRFVLSIDCDGIDPSVFPAVAMPTPGGLGYEDMSCCRFRGHRDKEFFETGGYECNDGSSAVSSSSRR